MGGYRTMPYFISRFTTGPREIYGRGPGNILLPDVKMLHEMSKDIVAQAHRAIRPPVLLMDDSIIASYDMRPGALNAGGLVMVGDRVFPAIQEMQSQANFPLSKEMLEDRRAMINAGFYIDLFRILVEEPQITATEALLRAQEKGQLLGPPMGRQQSEWFGPQIMRELDILDQARMIPPPPPELIEAGGIRVEYTAPLNRFQRAEEGVAIVNTVQAAAPFASIDPSVLRIFNVEKTVRLLASINGVPEEVLVSEEDFAAIKQQAAQQNQIQNLVAAAGPASNAIKNLSSAASTASSIPQPLPGIGAPQ